MFTYTFMAFPVNTLVLLIKYKFESKIYEAFFYTGTQTTVCSSSVADSMCLQPAGAFKYTEGSEKAKAYIYIHI